MGKEKLGLIHVYTGDGKGKTCASIGLALRAVGQGMKVYIIQFMKGGAYTGEFVSIKNFLPNIEAVQFGRKCVLEEKQLKLLGKNADEYPFFNHVRDDIVCGTCRFCFVNDAKQKEFVRDALARTKKVLSSGEYDLVVLDEVNCAVNLGFVALDEFLQVLAAKHKYTEVACTGRNAPKELIEVADYVTEMKSVKHPFDKGVHARRGVEY
ncbi:cob(I)yrinic acid a,c-diamide adenosyltransferase [Candidatus Woesearchaeota archaeon]|nr:cob(I)yrinic acid a,c-diamide adenosyltransferase [Candidatus Woesearchaeota archaeon]